MRYLRMLTNAVLAGGLGAAFVGVLILQLNPHLPLSPSVLLHLGQRLWVFYGINLAVLFYALIVIAQLLSRERLSPGWLSLRLLAWSSTLVTAGAAALMWMNVRGFGVVLEAESARRMAAGAAATTVCGFLLLTIAVVHYSFGRRGSRVGGTLYALTIGAALVLPLAARGWGGTPPRDGRGGIAVPLVPDSTGGSVVVLLVDGGSLDFISPITASGRLPHFARLLDEGATMHLATLRPTQPGPVWAAVLTGVYPPRNGVRATERYRFGADGHEVTLLPDLCLAHALVMLGILGVAPQDSGAFEARPLWSVLDEAGVPVGIVGVPLTHPAPRVDGYVVSDRLHLLTRATLPYREADLVFPEHLLTGLPDEVLQLAPSSDRQLPGHGPLPRDVFYAELARRLAERVAPRVRVTRYEGVDVAGHHYLRYAMPAAFGDVSPQDRQRLGQVLEQQYAWLDTELGAAMASIGPDDLLLVVSGFGMEPQSPGKRLLARLLGEPDLPGTHERAPDGFLLAWGRAVTPGRLPVGAIVDVAPTVLYFLGLPVARDMDGFARTDIFTRAFTAERPVTYIPTYGR